MIAASANLHVTSSQTSLLLGSTRQGDAYEAFKKFAAKTEDVIFVETATDAVGKAAGLKKAGVVAIKNHKGGWVLGRSVLLLMERVQSGCTFACSPGRTVP